MIRSYWYRRASGLALTALGLGACHGPGMFTGPGQSPSSPTSANTAHPEWTATTATRTPVAISGGTLLITRDGRTAVAADPERDTVTLVDLAARRVTAQIALQSGDEPGRAVEDDAGRVHVVLRAGGAIATIDRAAGTLAGRRAVCAAPRGIAYQSAGDALHVACADGHLVTLPAAGGDATRTLDLGLDLRDVVVDGDRLVVTRFRTAEMMVVTADGAMSRMAPQQLTWTWDPRSRDSTGNIPAPVQWDPTVAWRTVPLPRGGVAMVHQRSLTSQVPEAPPGAGYYAPPPVEHPGFCGESVVHGTVTLARRGGNPTRGPMIASAVLPVDVAVAPDESRVAVIAAGNAALARTGPMNGRTPDQQVQVFDLNGFDTDVQSNVDRLCANPASDTAQPAGQATAAAFTPQGQLVVQTRQPAALFFPGDNTTVTLPGDSRADLGHEIFHNNAGGRIACASCHPEGRDDGHIWSFDVGKRRTQNLLGGNVTRSGHLHWDGSLPNFEFLTQTVFTGRMNGGTLDSGQSAALAGWIDRLGSLPAVSPMNDAAQRGQVIFNEVVGSEGARCARCHSGDRLTNDQVMAVGTQSTAPAPAATFPGGPTPTSSVTVQFKVPSLRGVAWRAPYMHDGCAATLLDRFTNPQCGGTAHGQTADLSADQLNDLVAYLQTL